MGEMSTQFDQSRPQTIIRKTALNSSKTKIQRNFKNANE